MDFLLLEYVDFRVIVRMSIVSSNNSIFLTIKFMAQSVRIFYGDYCLIHALYENITWILLFSY
jgi:hypothetical protein